MDTSFEFIWFNELIQFEVSLKFGAFNTHGIKTTSVAVNQNNLGTITSL